MPETLVLTQENDYKIISLQNGKVNGITTQLLLDLKESFLQLEEDDNNKGIILTGRPHCFCAGIDIISYAEYNYDEQVAFWEAFYTALQAMIRYSKPFACAITGFAPAGGTILTCVADYRIMGRGEKHRIGMHEFKMSLQIPEMLSDIYAYALGEKRAWEAVQNASLFTSDEALEIGLVNESVDVDEVLDRAKVFMKTQIHVYGKVYSQSKKYFRKALLDIADRDYVSSIPAFIAFNDDPVLEKRMAAFLASIKK